MITLHRDASSALPLDHQVVRQVSEGVQAGSLRAGEQLPSPRELAESLKVSVAEVSRAYDELLARGIIELERTHCGLQAHYVRAKAESLTRRTTMRTLERLTASAPAQAFLSRVVGLSHHLMGIGSGGYPLSSGERGVIRLITRRYPPPYDVFDGGAYHGVFAGMVLDAVGARRLRLHCFEPGSATFRILRQRLAQDERVVLNQCGLGETRRHAALYYDAAGSGRASLARLDLRHAHIQFDRSETVTIDTVDRYCEDHSVDRVHLLKLDVEGCELGALTGARRMLEQRRIDLVQFEFGKANTDTRVFLKDYVHFFQPLDMSLFRITPSESLVPVGTYRETYEQFATTNYLAVRGEDAGRVMR